MCIQQVQHTGTHYSFLMATELKKSVSIPIKEKKWVWSEEQKWNTEVQEPEKTPLHAVKAFQCLSLHCTERYSYTYIQIWVYILHNYNMGMCMNTHPYQSLRNLASFVYSLAN